MSRKGWRLEPGRHGLAARGITTKIQLRNKQGYPLSFPRISITEAQSRGKVEWKMKFKFRSGSATANGVYYLKTKRAHLNRIDVRPQNVGLGTTAMKYIEKYLSDRGVEELTLISWPESSGFYEKLGYAFKEKSDSYDITIYEKRLR